MNPGQKATIKDNLPRLSKDISFEQLCATLLANGVICNDDEQVFKQHVLQSRRNIDLLEKLTTKDKGWETLLDCLDESGHQSLTNLLVTAYRDKYDKEYLRVLRTVASADEEAAVEECVNRLHRQLVNEYIRNVPLSSHKIFDPSHEGKFSESTYVTLEMKRSVGEEAEEMSCHGHRENCDRISGNEQLLSFTHGISATLAPLIILGHPGQGKTTFVHKLAHDWAMAQNGETKSTTTFLNQISLLFAFQLRNLKLSHEKIVDFLLLPLDIPPTQLANVKKWICENPPKVLVVLDGYDEMGGKCVELETILSTRRLPIRPDFPLIITSRPYFLPKECPWKLRFEICNLNPDQAHEIIQKHGNGYRKETVEKLVAFCLLADNAFLLSSPLLLHFLCVAVLGTIGKNDKPTMLSLPHSRTQTYITVVEWLAERQSQKRNETCVRRTGAPSVIQSDLIGALAALAFNIGGNRLIFDEAEVVRFCKREFADEAMALGYLVADVPLYGNVFCCSLTTEELKISFAHKTFQEFFAGIQIVRQLERGEEIRKFIASDLKSQREVLLFAIGVGCETKSKMTCELLEFVLQLVGNKLYSVVNDWYFDVDDESFLLAFLKAHFQETTDDGQRETLKQFTKVKADDFEVFAANQFQRCILEYVNYYTDYNFSSSFLEVAESLFPLCVGFGSFQSVNVLDRHFIFSRQKYRGGQLCNVLEISAAVAGILETETQETEVGHFLFHGTLSGLSDFLSKVAVRSNTAALTILKSPLKLPTHTIRQALGAETLKNAADAAKSSFNKIENLDLSWQADDAREITNVFKFLSTITTRIKALHFEGIRQSDDLSPIAAIVDDMAASERPPAISVEHLKIQGFKSKESSSKSRAAFNALLNCVLNVDCIEIGHNGLSLIDAFREGPNERGIAVVREIDSCDGRSPPNSSLAKFVSDVKATKLKIRLYFPSAFSVESFDEFCSVLAKNESNNQSMLEQLRIYKWWSDEPYSQFDVAKVVSSLVTLLFCVPKLQIELDLSTADERAFPLSLFPAEVQDRIKLR